MNNKTFQERLNEALANDPELNMISLDMNKVKDSIPQQSSQKLCEMIVCDRYFGFGEKLSPICMDELAKRRIAGDTFDFESYITEAHKSLPVLSTSMPDIREVLKAAIGTKVKI
jgi:hypothetical protein